MVYDNERAQVKISKGKVGGQSPAATRIKPLVSPASGNALNSPRKNVITHVKCCPPGKLTTCLDVQGFHWGLVLWAYISQVSVPEFNLQSRGTVSIYQIAHCQN